MKQTDILARTHRVKTSDLKTGTAFFIEHENQRFLLTANHLFENGPGALEVFWQGNWEPIDVSFVASSASDIDLAVFKTDVELPEMLKPDVASWSIEPDLKLGEEVRFYGFPFELSTVLSNNATSVALVKRGIVSGFFGAPLTSGDESFYIDAINNPGFSGGPVVCNRGNQYAIAGIISARHREHVDVYGLSSKGQADPQNVMGYTFQNAGIVLAHSIKHAIDLIENNPH